MPGVATHVVQTGKDGREVFWEADDFKTYLESLKKASRSYGCEVHAYTLLPNRVHILVTPEEDDSISRMIQYIGRYYVPYFNSKYDTKGSLWSGRYKASIIHEKAYLLKTMCFIESQPVKEGIVSHPGEHNWSSYGCNANAEFDVVIRPHPLFLSLGESTVIRCEHYKRLFDHRIDQEEAELIQYAWKSGTPLGEYDFLRHVEKELDTKVGYYRQGRPKKAMMA